MTTVRPVRLTPWVGRLLVANASVLVLLMTVLTDPAFRGGLVFDPGAPFAQPWVWVTHLFVHAGPLHLAIAMVFLYVFGPAVEDRIGGPRFLQLYLGCGLGAAAFGALLAGFVSLPPLLGASGAVLGVALAYALLWPDAELLVFPAPVPLSAATLLGILVILDLLAASRFAADGVAHFAHLGGLIVGYGWYRMQGFSRSRPTALARPTRQPVMATQLLARQEERADMVPPPPPAAPEPASSPRERERAELNRLLDKISADGLDSLTPQERVLLQEIAAKKRESETQP